MKTVWCYRILSSASSFLIHAPCIAIHAVLEILFLLLTLYIVYFYPCHAEKKNPSPQVIKSLSTLLMTPTIYIDKHWSHMFGAAVFTEDMLCLCVLSQQHWRLNWIWFRGRTSCRFPVYRQRWRESPGDSLLHHLLIYSHSNPRLTFMHLFHWYIIYTCSQRYLHEEKPIQFWVLTFFSSRHHKICL